RKPDFNESYYGFRAFGNLLEEAQARGLLAFGRDEKSGAYVYREAPPEPAAPAAAPRGTGRASRKTPARKAAASRQAEAAAGAAPAADEAAPPARKSPSRGRRTRKTAEA